MLFFHRIKYGRSSFYVTVLIYLGYLFSLSIYTSIMVEVYAGLLNRTDFECYSVPRRGPFRNKIGNFSPKGNFSLSQLNMTQFEVELLRLNYHAIRVCQSTRYFMRWSSSYAGNFAYFCVLIFNKRSTNF